MNQSLTILDILSRISAVELIALLLTAVITYYFIRNNWVHKTLNLNLRLAYRYMEEHGLTNDQLYDYVLYKRPFSWDIKNILS